jgi:homoserine O-acetyltransferase
VFGADQPLQLSSGAMLAPFTIAYETYGSLNAAKSNAVLVCHALTGDQYAGSPNPVTRRPAWWARIVGPGCPIDTNRFYAVCSNVLGGCMGTTGPASPAPDGTPYGLRFPGITVADMVRAQAMLLDVLEVPSLLCVIGGSTGGMQALQWATAYPKRVFACAAIATAARHSAQNIAFYEVGRQAIMADPDWRGGDYLAHGVRPAKGLAVARMAAHITYLSEHALRRKFDRALQDRDAFSFGFDADFQVESYLRHQGQSFVDRFDANSYLYITRAVDYFDLAADYGGSLAQAFKDSPTRFCIFAFSSDWHYPPSENREIARALIAAGAEASYVEVDTDKGHDAFLLDEPDFEAALSGFIDSAAAARGLRAGER